MKENPNVIQSSQNKQFKRFKSLSQKKYREKEGLYLLEGLRYVETAVNNGKAIEALIIGASLWETMKSTEQAKTFLELCPVYILPESLFEELVQTEQSQGIAGVYKIPNQDDLETLLSEYPNQTILWLDRLQDPGNLGTIIRTADAVGVDTILLSQGTVDPYNPKSVRSTAGSILNVSLINVEDAHATCACLKKYGYRIIATALEGAVDYSVESAYGAKNCLIIGNEANGISNELLLASDSKVKIPIVGGAESLNASVAAGIMLYKLHEYRHKKP